MASAAHNLRPLMNDASRTACAAEAAGILDDVRDAMERNPNDARAAALRLVALFTPPAETASSGARGGLAPWQHRRVDSYIREHLEQPMRLSELAQHISLSVGHFCRAFKESFGTTPHAHIVQLRLALAKDLLLATHDPLSQIASACGFADQAHLSKLFRRHVGDTPGTWRRWNITDTPPAPESSSPASALRQGPRIA
ncbi:MAG TPA: AraC family transcriptional regulator, partial [Rhodopila sp.]